VIDYSLSSRSVLVIEDGEDVPASVASALRALGCRVTVVWTGASALEAAVDDPPDVVLLAVSLPDLSGWEVVRWLGVVAKGSRKAPLLIAVTACGSDADRCRAAEVGVHLHLVAPVDPVILVGMLERFSRALIPSG